MAQNNSVNIREIVLDILLELRKEGEYSHLVIRNVLNKYNYLAGGEKAFIKRLTEGTLERRIELDYILNQYSKVPVNKMKPLIRELLRMSTYQILYMDGVPDSAACNEAVKLAAKRNFQTLKGFVNGVLRTVVKEKDRISYPEPDKNRTEYLSVRYSMPEWIVDLWLSAYGPARTESLLRGLLAVRPVTIRIRESLGENVKEDLLKQMAQQGVKVTPHPYLSYAYCLENVEGVAALPGYEEGLFAVQDVSSMLAVQTAGVQPGNRVLDVCAAPGGKAMHAADKLNQTGSVEARDISEYKVDYIRDNQERMQLSNVTARVWDATIPDETARESADIVLADVPCSGLGVIGKKRDIKYHMSREKIEEITALQRKIIDTVWQYVKPGGILLYSTCTINKEENEKMAAWITDNYPFRPVSLNPYLPEGLHSEETEQGHLQLLPGIHETDGFFVAKFERIQAGA